MNQRIPIPVQPIIDSYVSLVEQRLPGFLSGFYIVGSIALDGFNERYSDIDYVAVLNRRAVPADIDHLCQIHQVTAKNFPRWKMSGSYLQGDDLGRFEDEVEPHPFCHDGALRRAGHYELNSVTWWILKNHGIAVMSAEPRELAFTVDWNQLIAKMHENLNTYWVGWTKRPDRIMGLLTDWGVQWTVLGVLRQFYTFKEHTISTKEQAGEYALGCLPIRWHRIIREGIRIRAGESGSAYRFRTARTIEAIGLMKYVIQTCNAMLG